MNSSSRLALIALCVGSAVTLLNAQTPAAPAAVASKLLMQEPLGAPTDPKMSLFILTLPAGRTAPSHSHAGIVFAYLLEGDIENQVDPDPPKLYHPGDSFHEAPMQVHRLLRNLSMTEPVKLLIFQNTGTLPQGLQPLIQEPLAHVTNQDVRVTALTMPPGWQGAGREDIGAHQHPGPVFAYILKGEVESQVDPDPLKTYRAGDVFYEPPMHAHRLFRNASKTSPAEVLIFQIFEKGAPTAIAVK
jgi:quercetin dioxygenase-like cupin family protein